MTHIGQLIKRNRFDRAITGVELAKKLGCSPQFICNWERGASNPPLNMLKKICLLTGIKLADAKKALVLDYSEKIDKETK